MSCIHYKFKSSKDYDTLTFDGLHISLADLKKAIMQHKKMTKTGSLDFDLQIVNAQTREVYKEADELIPKNTSVVVARIPVGRTSKPWDPSQGKKDGPAQGSSLQAKGVRNLTLLSLNTFLCVQGRRYLKEISHCWPVEYMQL